MNRLTLAIAAGTLCAPAAAQTPVTGVYTFATLDTPGFEQVNVGNLNVRFTIPIVSKSGRGIPFNYALQYEGLIWNPVNNGTSTTWVPNTSWGFSGTLNGTGFLGYLWYISHSQACGSTTIGSRRVTITDNVESNFVYSDPLGAVHPFNYTYTTACQDPYTGQTLRPALSSGDGSSNDGSGYTLVNSGTQVRTIAGALISPPLSPSGSGNQLDSNGNQITYNGSGSFTDTTGANALSITGSNPVKLTYPVVLQANSATSASASLYYQTYTVRTLFNCSNIGEYGTNSVSLLDHITLADGETYSFRYEGTPGASDGAVTGRLSSLTLPTGGTISYTYSGGPQGVNGIWCADGSVPALTRTTTYGTRQYQRGGVAGNSLAFTTNVVDEKNNTTVYHFSVDSNGNYEATHQQVYSGSPNGSPLKEVVTCYNGSAGNCDGQTIARPITEADTTTSYNGGSQDILKNSYDISGELLNSAAYSGAALLVQTANSYSSGEVLSTKTTDSSGNTVSLSTFGYDETTPTATSGLPQRGSAASTRGNQTSAHVSVDGSTTNLLSTTTSYYDTGMPLSSTALGTFTTSYGYDSTQTFATSTTLPTPSSGVSLSTSATYDSASGANLSVTGMNSGQTVTTTQYDQLLRPTSITTPVGGQMTTAYTANQISVQAKMSSTQTTDQETFLDAYGRVKRVAVASSSGWYLTDSCYDATGLLQYQSMAYLSSSQNPSSYNCSSSTGAQYTYDALGRPVTVTQADGSSTTWAYNSRAVRQQDSPGTTKISQMDLLGRLTGICEVSSTSYVSDSPTSCGMDIAGTGFLTNYTYDLANHKTTITQGVQTRVFQTDAAGRQILVQEPERGNTTYSYAYNSTGLVVTRTRPRANQTNASVTTQTVTQYDSLSRVVSVTYNDGSTQTKSFGYDQLANHDVIADGGATKGQMTGMSNGVHARQFAYDIMGRISETVECLPDWCSNGTSQDPYRWYTYDYLGNVTSEKYSTSASGGTPVTVSYAYNNAGQLTGMSGGQNDASASPNVYGTTSSSMLPFGPQTVTFGNNLKTAFAYDPLGRLQGRWLCSGSGVPNCTGGSQIYGVNSQRQGSQVQILSDTVDQSYSDYFYDDLGRLAGASAHPGQTGISLSATYDRYGNRWAESVSHTYTGQSLNPSFSFDKTKNQIVGAAYDAAGNLLNDGVYTYAYDAENNLTAIGGGATATYAYNGLNQRVKASVGGVTERYSLDLSGRRSTTWGDGASPLKATKYYGDRGPVAFWSGVDGHIHFEHPDFIGTERVRTSASGAVESGYNSEPYGEVIDTTGTDLSPSHYALLDQDVSVNSGLLHGMFREYSSTQGRWSSPDPYNGSYNAAEPQSLNRYTYAANNPLGFVDPSGRDYTDCQHYSFNVDGEDNGSQWVCFPVYTGGSGYSSPPWYLTEYGSYGKPGGQCFLSNGGVVPCPSTQPTAAASAPKAPQAPNSGITAKPGDTKKKPSIFDHWPFNGNLLPLTPQPQDNVCTTGPLSGPMNSNPLILSCCQAHDDCYAAHGCNATSWVPNPLPSGACNSCNLKAASCINNALPIYIP